MASWDMEGSAWENELSFESGKSRMFNSEVLLLVFDTFDPQINERKNMVAAVLRENRHFVSLWVEKIEGMSKNSVRPIRKRYFQS